MSSIEEIRQDIGVFLSHVKELTQNDQRELLLAMFQKHLVINSSEILLSKFDFDTIVSNAKSLYAKESVPEKIGGKDFYRNDASSLFLIEATISLLNNKGALKRLPKFERN